MYDDTTTIIVAWVILAGVVGAIASQRGHGFLGYFLLSAFLSPVIGLVVLLTQKRGDEPVRAPCWQCREPVIVGALKCSHCGAELVWPEATAKP